MLSQLQGLLIRFIRYQTIDYIVDYIQSIKQLGTQRSRCNLDRYRRHSAVCLLKGAHFAALYFLASLGDRWKLSQFDFIGYYGLNAGLNLGFLAICGLVVYMNHLTFVQFYRQPIFGLFYRILVLADCSWVFQTTSVDDKKLMSLILKLVVLVLNRRKVILLVLCRWLWCAQLF